MAIYRHVHVEFWKDPKVLEELTPEDKLFFIYLLTNPNTTQIGVYKITKKQIAFELGFSIESVNALMDRFINNYGLIKYNNDTREICLKNWGKYNLNKLGKPMLDCVRSELKNVDDKSLLEFIKPSISKDEIVSLFDGKSQMEATLKQLENSNIPYYMRKRMSTFIKSQVKNNLDTQENYKCNKCNDRTFILIDNEAVPCECRALREAESILKHSGISKEFSKKTFDNFDYSRNAFAVNIYTLAKCYANSFKDIEKERCNSVLFMGQSGCGKTHLSLAIANNFMKNGIGVVYMNYREDMTSIKQNILDSEVYNKYLNRYKNARVLLIDDLFKGNITPSDINIIFEIINYRYFNNKPIIVSTEKYKSDLLKIDEAIGSRILEMCDKFNIEVRGKGLNYRIYG